MLQEALQKAMVKAKTQGIKNAPVPQQQTNNAPKGDMGVQKTPGEGKNIMAPNGKAQGMVQPNKNVVEDSFY